MKSRVNIVALSVLGGMLLCSLLLIGWAFLQVYGVGGWRDEVYALSGANAAQQAMDDFRQNKLRLYVLGQANDKRHFTGSNDGPFEIWMPVYYPELGHAHRYSTEQFVEFYNRKMVYMHSHSNKFSHKIGN